MTKIEWCDETINPIIGCSKVSPGCDNCYAERMAVRLSKMPKVAERYGQVVKDGKWNGKAVFVESELEKPKKWKKPKRIFVGSMGDIFHESVDIYWQILLFSRMSTLPHHTFIVVTKRPENALKFCIQAGLMPTPEPFPITNDAGSPSGEIWPENVWFVFTAEDQEQYDKRVRFAVQIPAPIIGVSVEPMLGPINLNLCHYCQLEPDKCDEHCKLDWVICGGESGTGARPMHPEWVRSLRNQCRSANMPFFFKQWGEWGPRSELGLCNEDPECKKWPESIRMCSCGGDARTDTGILPMCGCGGGQDEIYMQKCGKKRSGFAIDNETYKEFPKPTATGEEGQ